MTVQDVPSPRILAEYGGAKPPAPAWFEEALAVPCEELRCTHDGAELEVLAWGEPGAPGVLLLHGNRAHARWWSPIAGLLASRYRVATLSWSGMGGSSWRHVYSSPIHAAEAMAAARAASLFDRGKPVVVSHSFGTGPGLAMTNLWGNELAGLVVVDSEIIQNQKRPDIGHSVRQRISPSIEDALVRFRLAPPQDCANHFYVDWIARNGLSPSEDGTGWVWSFDPLHWDRYKWFDKWQAIADVPCPMAFIYGENSVAFDQGAIDALRQRVPANTEWVTIPGSAHHVMLDQPLALKETIDRIAARMLELDR